jgi:hypothetical protein
MTNTTNATNMKQRQSGCARLLVILLSTAAGLATALPAAAQEFVKVEDGAREQLPATPFVGAAYGFIWLALLLYLLVVARGLARVQNDLLQLRRRLERSGADASKPK